MKKVLLVSLILWLLGGCNHTLSTSKDKDVPFVVKMPTSAYGKKYHFIIEKRSTSRAKDISGFFGKTTDIVQYHIYTNSLKEVTGDKILFSESKRNKAYKLSRESLLIFNSNSLSIRNTQWCNRLINKCSDSGLNKIYPLKNYITLSRNYEDIQIENQGYYK